MSGPTARYIVMTTRGTVLFESDSLRGCVIQRDGWNDESGRAFDERRGDVYERTENGRYSLVESVPQ